MRWEIARAAAAAASPLPSASLALTDALGAVLAKDLVAAQDVPSFDAAAMDGYAVAGDGPWAVLGSTRAGQEPGPALVAGHAWRVTTGAPVPVGTDRVVRDEDATLAADGMLTAPGHSGGVVAERRIHIRRRGSEATTGDALLPAGTAVAAYALGLAAAAGHDRLTVHPRPRVRLLVTGDELAAQGRPAPGRVRDALGPLLPPVVTALGGRPTPVEYLADDPDLLRKALDADGEQVLVTTGASAHGPADHLRPVLDTLGARWLVEGVACRPGHPMLLAALPDGRHVVGLPGNPLAAVAGVVTLLAPLLGALTGLTPRPLPTATLAVALDRHPVDTRLVPVTVDGPSCRPTGHDGAPMLRGLVLADALAVLPPGDGPAAGPVALCPLPGLAGR